MKILNLFAGIGGNRALWGGEHEITAVEFDPKIAAIYKKRFPNDIMVIEDAYEYLEKNMDKFDFIWASPPCTTHTRLMVMNVSQNAGKLPDLRLYSIIIYLNRWFKGKYVVENVIPYYKTLIAPSIELERHYFWTNFAIIPKKFDGIKIGKREESLLNIDNLITEFGIDCNIFDGINKNLINKTLRNSVNQNVGKYILDQLESQTIFNIF